MKRRVGCIVAGFL